MYLYCTYIYIYMEGGGREAAIQSTEPSNNSSIRVGFYHAKNIPEIVVV